MACPKGAREDVSEEGLAGAGCVARIRILVSEAFNLVDVSVNGRGFNWKI